MYLEVPPDTKAFILSPPISPPPEWCLGLDNEPYKECQPPMQSFTQMQALTSFALGDDSSGDSSTSSYQCILEKAKQRGNRLFDKSRKLRDVEQESCHDEVALDITAVLTNSTHSIWVSAPTIQVENTDEGIITVFR
jgi:hypothetical protein